MLEELNWCKNIMKNNFNKPLKMTNEDEENFNKSNECYICGKKYKEKDIRVRDHCHITGKYRGSAHQDCNLKLKIKPEEIKIPIIFHNLRGCDSHFIMQEIGKFNMNVNVIPNNTEKYMAFMLGKHLLFIDSFQYMASSLHRLVNNLPTDGFKYTSELFKNKEEFKFMTKKVVYPYDYMDSFDKFNKTELPSKEDFYSLLIDEHISDEQYKHAQLVWDVFDMKNMGDYHDLYLYGDILLLADVFENLGKHV